MGHMLCPSSRCPSYVGYLALFRWRLEKYAARRCRPIVRRVVDRDARASA